MDYIVVSNSKIRAMSMYKLVEDFLKNFKGTFLVGQYDMEYLLDEELEFLIFDRNYYRDYYSLIEKKKVIIPKRLVLISLEEEKSSKLLESIIYINGKTNPDRLYDIFDIEVKKEEIILEDRDKSILYLLSQGYTNKDIGKKLYLSEKTIKNNLTRIYSYLGVENKFQAINLVRDIFEKED